MKTPQFIELLPLIALAACACQSESLRPKAAYADGMSSDQYRAAYDIASARCDRQTSACSAFPSRGACLAAKLDVSASDSGLPRCNNDVDPARVQTCVAEIERGQCGTGIAQLSACQRAELCPYQSQEATF